MLITFIILGVVLVAVLVFVLVQLGVLKYDFNQRLQETNQILQRTHETVGQRLDNATNVIGSVFKSLGGLEQSTARVLEISKDISSLQDLLKPPTFRGALGETLLNSLITEVFPKEDFYEFQYRFKSGEKVDAVIKLGGRLIPIDAKFPLDNFQKLFSASSDDEKRTCRRLFFSDVKKKVDDIASKYILPDEGTFEFALMYIPAESVYYEIILDEDFYRHAIHKKVIPVSPNTFYSFLQVILFGLKGLSVEDNAKEILENLAQLKIDLTKFNDDFKVLGTHIKNARDKYDDTAKKLEKLTDKLNASQEVRE